jgi:hypothetical protein
MEGEQRPPEERRGKRKAASHADIRLRPRRRSAKHNQGRFPRAVRAVLWLGLPIGLWAALFAVIRLFE